MLLRKLTEADVTFSLRIEDEDRTPRQYFMDECNWQNDPENFPESEGLVLELERRLERGDLWAFGCVILTAEWEGYSSFATLGCCSYRDEADFKQDDYYQSMKDEALDDLNAVLAHTAAELSVLESHPDVW